MTTRGPAAHLDQNKEVMWHEVHQLSIKHTKSDLALGSPEEGLHLGVVKELGRICSDPETSCVMHQYSQFNGHPRLLKALADFYSPLYQRELEPSKEILITNGANYGIYCAFIGIIDPGDEVLMLEPFYELFPTVVKQARGTPVYVPLRPPKTAGASTAEWTLDMQELEDKVTSKTKMIIVNNPHNPLGKVFTRAEIEGIANVARKYDLIVLMDEVYEFVVYDGLKHVKMATLPGMWERTITLGSSSKAFNVTGWRIGWAIAPAHLIKCLFLVHQECSRYCATPFQEALAIGLENEKKLMGTDASYWTQLCRSLQAKRDILASSLASVGVTPYIPQGTYFMVSNFSELASKLDLDLKGGTRDVAFFRWLCKSKGLLSVPMSIFYSKENKHLGENYIRFCFIKKKSTLESGTAILQEIKSQYC